MRLYIAGPMSGYPGFNYPAFDRAEELLVDLGYEVENPTANDKIVTVEPKTWQWYMRASLAQVLTVEGIACLPDWNMSRGARLEVDIALQLQMPVMSLDFWMEKGYTMRGKI